MPRAAAEREIDELRRLLLQGERERIAALEERKLEVSSRDVSDVLPEAVLMRAADDEQLSRALAPTIEAGIETSARKNPQVLADAIFPVLGPAIRKAIQAALAAAVEGVNTALENSLSIQSLKWRWEARRSGRPFSEIVLVKNLVYRVEHVFLFHRETGLPLAQAVAPAVATQDADLVATMFTAISNWVRDSIHLVEDEEDSELQQITISGARVMIVRGPHAVLAGVVRGNPPTSVRLVMQRAIEAVHLERGEDLVRFDGDDTPFRATLPHLESCLQEQRRQRKRSPVFLAVMPVAIVVLALLGVWWGVQAHRRSQAWDAALEALRAAPGYQVFGVREEDSERVVSGLRDSFAAAPEDVLLPTGVDPDTVRFDFDTYESREFLERRVRERLAAPEGVGVDVEDGVVTVTGAAPTAWIDHADRIALGTAGVGRFDRSELVDSDFARMQGRVEALDGRVILFAAGSAAPTVGDRAELEGRLRDIDEAASSARRIVSVTIRGGARSDESPDGEGLGAERAAAVQRFVYDLRLESVVLQWLSGGGESTGRFETRLDVRILSSVMEAPAR
ncbi:MAG: hypothetical protein GY711_23545 [bacterium]|nr:hypothetical protein [bacterium]